MWRALDLEVECQWMKGRPNRTWKKQVEKDSVKVDLRKEDALCRSRLTLKYVYIYFRGIYYICMRQMTFQLSARPVSIDIYIYIRRIV